MLQLLIFFTKELSMEKTLIFQSVDAIQLKKLLRFIIPTYLTSLFTTVYTIVDGIFVSAYIGTNALAAINVVYPLVNILYVIALAFATGGSAVAAHPADAWCNLTVDGRL